MQPIYLAIGFVEGLITAAVLCFIYEMRANVLLGVEDGAFNHQKFTFSKLFALLSVITLVVAGLLSLVASELPDGLEWSLERE